MPTHPALIADTCDSISPQHTRQVSSSQMFHPNEKQKKIEGQFGFSFETSNFVAKPLTLRAIINVMHLHMKYRCFNDIYILMCHPAIGADEGKFFASFFSTSLFLPFVGSAVNDVSINCCGLLRPFGHLYSTTTGNHNFR